MSSKTPPPSVTHGEKPSTFGSIFAACNLQLEANFLANDRPKNNISFENNSLKSSLKQHHANFFETLKPTFMSTPMQGLIDLASDRNNLKTDKTTCWGKEGLLPLNHLVGFTQCSLRVKDAALSKVFSGEMDISKLEYPDTSNDSIRDIEILYLQNQVQKFKEARYLAIVAEKSDPSFENLEFWTSHNLLPRISRERYTALNPTQASLLGGLGQRAELIATWTCATGDFNFRQPAQIYSAPLTSVTLAEKLDYISRRGLDKSIITHADLPFSTVLGVLVDAEFASHKLTRRSTDTQLLLTKSFFNLTFDAQKESSSLLSKQQDTRKQVKQMRADAEELVRTSIKPSLLDDEDNDRLQRFEFKDFLVIVLTKQLGQHEIKKNLMEPIIDSFVYDEVRNTNFDLKSFFKSLTHLIGIDILTRTYKSTKFTDPKTHFRDFQEILSSIPMTEAEYNAEFNCTAANRAIARVHTPADYKDIFINSVKNSALHDKALEIEKKRDTMTLDQIRLAFRDSMKDLKDKTHDKCEDSVIHTEREVRNLTSRLDSLENGHTARSTTGTHPSFPSNSGGAGRRSNRDNDDRSIGSASTRVMSDRSRSPSAQSHNSQASRGRPNNQSNRGDNSSRQGSRSDSEHSGRTQHSRASRGSFQERRHSGGAQSGGGRSSDRDRSRSRDRNTSREPQWDRNPNFPSRSPTPDYDVRQRTEENSRHNRGNSPFPYGIRSNQRERGANRPPHPADYRPTRGRIPRTPPGSNNQGQDRGRSPNREASRERQQGKSSSSSSSYPRDPYIRNGIRYHGYNSGGRDRQDSREHSRERQQSNSSQRPGSQQGRDSGYGRTARRDTRRN